MDAVRVVERLAGERLTALIELPAAPPSIVATPESLPLPLRNRLMESGVDALYSHQAEAISAAETGRDVVIVTGTGSGKTLCYNLPVLAACLREPAARALYIYPTKALAQDQLGKLVSLAPEGLVHVGCYDGDTPRSARAAIRKNAHIVLTNPDMLHVGILPQHESWTKFLRSLRYIVVDELHAYSGVFGSHVAGVLRRLLRLCEWHHSRPQVIACSATIGNASALFHGLTGREPLTVAGDGAPKSRRWLAMVDAPAEDTAFSPNRDTASLLASFASTGVRSLAFCRARISTELVVRYARQFLEERGGEFECVESYRGGYTPKERREIEQAFFKGRLMGLAATNAMELGVDVGGLDAVVMNGYPGSVSSFWQQAGRAGRAGREGLAVMIAHQDPLEQFLCHNPDWILRREIESVGIRPGNPHVLGAQLRCAAYERALAPEELDGFAPNARTVAGDLCESGDLALSAGRFFFPSHTAPAPKVSIRGVEGGSISIFCQGEPIGEMERWRALMYAHEGAVYLHRSNTFRIEGLDLDKGIATASAGDPGYYTTPVVQSAIETTVPVASRAAEPFAVELTGLNVTTVVAGFRMVAQDGSGMLGEHGLKLPPQSYDSMGVRISLPQDLATDPESIGAVHGAEHAILTTAPIFAGCNRQDLGSAWYMMCADSLAPALFVYDRIPGGVGLSESLFERFDEWIAASRELLAGCPCEGGCPRCLFTSSCEVDNEALSKSGALRLLGRVWECATSIAPSQREAPTRTEAF